jgi:hypothetical protein
VPSDGNPAAADGYYFAVYWADDDGISDKTPQFELEEHPDSIGVNAPQANLMLGQSATVTWHVPASVEDNDKANIYLIEAGAFNFCNGNLLAALCGDKKTKVGTAPAKDETMDYIVPANINQAEDYRYYVNIEGKSSIDGESVEFEIETSVIKVTMPKGGTVVKEGDEMTITVEAYGVDADKKIKLELYDDVWWWTDTKHHAIVDSAMTWTAAQGVWKKATFKWTVPALGGDYNADDNYYIRASVGGTDVVDESSNFEIARRGGSLKIKSPKTDDRLITTEDTTITWDSDKIDANTKLNIYLKRDGAQESFLNFLSGKDIDLLTVSPTGGVPNTGSYTWSVPSTTELPNLKKGPDYYDGYYLVVEIAGFPSVNAQSGEFYLQDASIVITNPKKDQEIEEGTTLPITWNTRGLNGNEKVTIELHKASVIGFGLVSWFDEQVYEINSDVASGAGEFDWEVPSDLEVTGDHYLKAIVNNNVQDQSETFEIVRQKGTIVVDKPKEGDDAGIIGIFGAVGRQVFVSNAEIEIQWTTEGIPGDATYSVDLHLDGGIFASDTVKSVAKAVAAGTDVNGKKTVTKYTYTVPAGIKEDDDYYFRITRDEFPASYADSKRFELKKATLEWISPEPKKPTFNFDFLNPGEGTTYEEGDKVKVTWKDSGIPDDATMTISLMDYDFIPWNDDTHSILNAAVANSGETYVDLPKNGLRLGDSYYFKITWNADKRVEALTNYFTFTGKEGSFAITVPEAGAKLIPHEEVTITWTSKDIPEDAVVDLHLYESRNAFIGLFAADGKSIDIGKTKNTGAFTWKVPDLTPSDDYYIKATWTEFRSVITDSEEFEIVQGVVSVKPFAADSANYIHNQQVTVEWDFEGLKAEEKVDLTLLQYEKPGSFWDVINIFKVPTGQASMVKGIPLGDKKYVYTIPNNLPASQHYVVQLQVQGKPGIQGTSADACAEGNKACSEWLGIQNHAGKLKITDPNAKSAPLRFGDQHEVAWTSSVDIPASAVLEIELYEEVWWPFNDRQKVVIKDVPNTGSFAWDIPSTGLEEGNDYYLSITWKEHPTVTHESDKFGIYKEYIRLAQETLSGTIQEGKEHIIKWDTKGIPAGETVSIELFNDGFLFFDSSVKHIAKNVQASDQQFAWMVPNTLKAGDDYYVVITWDKNDDVYDQSQTFTLKGRSGSITIKEPSSDSSDILWISVPTPKKFVAGKSMDITWDSKGLPADAMVSISVYVDANILDVFQLISKDFKVEVVAETAASAGSYTWKIPGGLRETNGYYVVVTYLDCTSGVCEATSVLDESDDFALVKGLITVENPTKGVASGFLSEGEAYTIKWNAEGPGPEEKMTIRLMDDDWFSRDDEHALIAKDVANTGSFKWTLPNDLPVPDDAFYVSVEWSADASVVGQSENFEIRAHPGSIKTSITDCGNDCLYAPTETSTITWTTDAMSGGTVRVELWEDRFILGPRKIDVEVATKIPNSGTVGNFDWTVPFKLEGTFFYRVYWDDFPSVYGDSGEFKIGKSGLIKNVVGVPLDGTAPAIYHEQLQITWDAPRLSADTVMMIELFDSDAPLGITFGTTWFDEHHADITKRVKNTGEFTWNIPASGLEVDDTDDFFIVVSVVEDTEVSGKSDQFKIEPPIISDVGVTPDAINHVTTLEVDWKASRFAADAQVVIELWDDQGFFSKEEKVLVMATVPASQGSYSWIPAKHAGLLPSEGYKVRVHWDLNANVFADSGDFEIMHDGPVIRVLQPSENVDVVPGTPTSIEWVSHDLVPAHMLSLELWDRQDSANGDSKDTYLANIDNVENSGKHDWTPSASQLENAAHTEGSTYFVRIRWEGTFEDPGDDETVSDSAQFMFTPYGRPGKPQLNTENTDAIGVDSIDIMWVESVTTGSVNLLGYEVQVLPLKISASGEPWKETACSLESPCTGETALLEGLDSGVGYRFKVRAVVMDGGRRRRRQAEKKKTSAWSEESEQIITALRTTSTTTVAVPTTRTVTTTTTETPKPPPKPTGKIPNLLTTTLSSDATDGSDDGNGSTTESPTDLQDVADKLEDKLDDAKENANELCGDCVAAGDCSDECTKAQVEVEEAEKEFAEASQAALDVGEDSKKKGGAIAGAIVGVLLVIVLLVIAVLYRKRAASYEGEVPKQGNGLSFENPTYDQVGLESGGAATATAPVSGGSLTNPTYDSAASGSAYDNATTGNPSEYLQVGSASGNLEEGAGAAYYQASANVQGEQKMYSANDGQVYDAAAASNDDTYGDLPEVAPVSAGSVHVDSEA